MTYKIKSGERALFYLPEIGRRRIYRQTEGAPSDKLKLLTYKSEKYAQGICDEINRVYNDSFKVTPIK